MQLCFHGRQTLAQRVFLLYGPLPLRRRPHRRGKVAVPVKAGDDMPMQVRHHIAQSGKIDFGGLQVLAQGLLNHRDGFHTMLTVSKVKV